MTLDGPDRVARGGSKGVRARIRANHSSARKCGGGRRQFVRFHAGRHPREMGEADVTVFLSSLAVEGHVAASRSCSGTGTSARP